MDKFNVAIQDGNVIMGVDSNADGENSLDLTLNMSEAIQEIFARGEAVEGNKLVSFGFEGKRLNLAIDSDKDGEKLLTLSIDLGEILDEVF